VFIEGITAFLFIQIPELSEADHYILLKRNVKNKEIKPEPITVSNVVPKPK